MKFFALLLTMLHLVLPASAQSGNSSSTPALVDSCRTQTASVLAGDQRLYRRVLFGLTHAEEASKGETRYDSNGNAWIKAGSNVWRTQAKGLEGHTLTDSAMDAQIERDPIVLPDPLASNPQEAANAQTFRRGIFETRGVLTSELIPRITESFRALQCRTLSTCEAMRRSLRNDLADGKDSFGKDIYRVRVSGCEELPVRVLTACTSTTPTDPSAMSILIGSCGPMQEGLISREEKILGVAVTYDAAYRSLLQFAGNFDDFLSVFNVDLLTPLRQSTGLLGQLSRIPCFLSQCNE